MISINEKHIQESSYRGDIYRKFEKQFKYLLSPEYVDSEMYVDYDTDTYKEAFKDFESSIKSEIKFIVGFAGVGKSTFIRHYFNYQSFKIIQKNNNLIIPIGWNGIMIQDDNAIISQLLPSIYHAIDTVYESYDKFFKKETDKIIEYIKSTRQDILSELTIEEIINEDDPIKRNQIRLIQTQYKFPVEFACSILKYVLEYHNQKFKIKRVIFIADDTETLSEKTISRLVEKYLSIWTCLQNTKSKKVIVDLLISLRPHSYRFLKNNLNYGITSPYGLFLENNNYIIHKKDIPNIKDIFKKRFEYAIKNTDKPGNPATWDKAKNVLYAIVDNFDKEIIEMITDLCHQDIRAITNLFQMILSNRVWGQEIDSDNAYPKVTSTQDFKFDIVNVVRTLACGENPVYSGIQDVQFNQNNFRDTQFRPSFDGSKVFIPNILNNIVNKECDILAALIMYYLESYQSSGKNTPMDSERITKRYLRDRICDLFNTQKTSDYINDLIDYLFHNRVIRKSIYSIDDEHTLETLKDNDYIYFTCKGSRLLKMLESDSVLLEIYREDIKRDYSEKEYESSAFSLIKNGNRDILFKDLVLLAREIYLNEDEYCYSMNNKNSVFNEKKFAISKLIITGIKCSLNRSSLEIGLKYEINKLIIALERDIDSRIHEIEGE